MLKVFGKSILNGVFEQIHLLTKKYLKYQNTKYSICRISNTKYKKYFKNVLEIQVFQILPTSAHTACLRCFIFRPIFPEHRVCTSTITTASSCALLEQARRVMSWHNRTGRVMSSKVEYGFFWTCSTTAAPEQHPSRSRGVDEEDEKAAEAERWLRTCQSDVSSMHH